MRIIISPAKKMNVADDVLHYQDLPVFLDRTEVILEWLRSLSMKEAQKLWGCSDRLAQLNYERLTGMKLTGRLTPAVISYEGIQYQHMAPAVFEDRMLEYIQHHLRILSGFYGVLKPMDGVTPYRLEMQAKAGIGDTGDLYEFWGKKLYDEIIDESGIIINLASKEYSRCIEKYLQDGDIYITCVFGEIEGGRVKQKGTYAKMARGEMVRFMAENQIDSPEGLKSFDRLQYSFSSKMSTDKEYVFIRESKSDNG
ncbi:MAG: peroxide stress protein YaaA [Firmicutes bacterium]|nr:peroxide stress protein YaaA [Bacillota bacterium]